MNPGSDTVTRVRYADERDAFGDLAANVAPLEVDIPGCSVQPRATNERVDQRDTVVTLMTAFLPPGSDVTHTDQLRYRGDLYQIDAAPENWVDLHASEHHIELQLRRVEG